MGPARRHLLRLLLLGGAVAAGVGAWAWLQARAATAAPVAVLAVEPDSGPAAGGTLVQIEGSGFAPGTIVEFGGVRAAAVHVRSPSSLTALSPPGTGTIEVSVIEPGGGTAPPAHDWFAYESAPTAPWLGLDRNSVNVVDGHTLGPVGEFSAGGIVFDRTLDLTAGESLQQVEPFGEGVTTFADRLRIDHENGMVPVAIIDFRGNPGNFAPTPYFPREERSPAELSEGKTTIGEYVEGFISSATAILTLVAERYPGMPVLLEPMNEPWAYTTPWYEGAQYARVLARLLPAARAAGIPLADIYVSAFGADQRLNGKGEKEAYEPGWVAAMYAAEPALEHEIEGWYFHPYGPPAGSEMDDSWGIQSLPAVRSRMTSGEDNIIVSEVGYCAREAGGDCHETGQAEVADQDEAAARLPEMLENARPYHEAGWLHALIVYARSDGGWSMQDYPSGRLNALGEAYEAFALAHGESPPPSPCAGALADSLLQRLDGGAPGECGQP